MDQIPEFLDHDESKKVTREEIGELGNLERTLDRTWKYARHLATSENLDTPAGPVDSTSMLGTAVGDTFRETR
jgi:hypothetical protein